MYTPPTPALGIGGTASIPGYPEGQGERFDYAGHLEDAFYVHTEARRYILGRYIDGEDPRVPVSRVRRSRRSASSIVSSSSLSAEKWPWRASARNSCAVLMSRRLCLTLCAAAAGASAFLLGTTRKVVAGHCVT